MLYLRRPTERPGDEVNQDLLHIDLPALQLVESIPQRPEVSSYSWRKYRGSELSVETSDKVTRRTRVMPGSKDMSALCPVLTEDRS